MVPVPQIQAVEFKLCSDDQWETSIKIGGRNLSLRSDWTSISKQNLEMTPTDRADKFIADARRGWVYHFDTFHPNALSKAYLPFGLTGEPLPFGDPQLKATDGTRIRLSDVRLLEAVAIESNEWYGDSFRVERLIIGAHIHSRWATLYDQTHIRNVKYPRTLYSLVKELPRFPDGAVAVVDKRHSRWYGDYVVPVWEGGVRT